MREIYIKSKAGLLPIGKRGENLATRVHLSEVPADGQSVTVFVLRDGDSVAYPASEVEVTDTEVIWTVTSVDTGKSGRGKVQYRFSDSVTGEVIKTEIYYFIVSLAIDTEVGPAPDPYETWVDSLVEAARDIKTMTVEATTLPAGSEATASYSDGVLYLGIPAGEQGEQGAQGDSFVNMWPRYKRATTASEAASSGGSWSRIPQLLTSTYKYLGCYWEIRKEYGDGSSLNWTTEPFLLGVYGDKGEKGDKGDTGVQGPAGSDASVTAQNIANALGYTPVSPSQIPTVTNDFTDAYKSKVDTLWDDYSDALAALG